MTLGVAAAFDPFAAVMGKPPCPVAGCGGHLIREEINADRVNLLCTDCPHSRVVNRDGSVLDPPSRKRSAERWGQARVVRRIRGRPRVARDPCAVAGCRGDHYAKGLCQRCYERWRSRGKPDVLLFVQSPPPGLHGPRVRAVRCSP